jgi:hypothetical protein
MAGAIKSTTVEAYANPEASGNFCWSKMCAPFSHMFSSEIFAPPAYIQRVTLEKDVGPDVKRSVFLTDFNQTWNMSTDVNETPEDQV